jgi:hypothetical protein
MCQRWHKLQQRGWRARPMAVVVLSEARPVVSGLLELPTEFDVHAAWDVHRADDRAGARRTPGRFPQPGPS